MRMNLQKATHLASSLLLAAWLGAFSPSVQAKPAGRKAAGSTAHSSSHKRRSEEHTSELQSRLHLVCRLLLEKKQTSPAFSNPAKSPMLQCSVSHGTAQH